jgi:tetratricopeptide (TPR) repeat protein
MGWDFARLSRLPRRHWRWSAALLLLAGAAIAGAPHVRAWYHWRAALTDLEHFRGAAALAHLRVCLDTWPSSAPTHLLAARAARLAGDSGTAQQHLRECQRRQQPSPDEVVFEWALLRASVGDLAEVEVFLAPRAQKDPTAAPLVWEALAQGYARTYRIFDALACLDRWLKFQPDCAHALGLRGKIFLNVRAAARGLPDLRKAVALDPGDPEKRWDLALCLMEANKWNEAIPYLEELRAQRPGDPDILTRLARCHHLLDRIEPARALLDAVLAEHPDHGLALRTRGQMMLSAGNAAEAEKSLRRAVEVLPHDYHAHDALYRALLRQDRKSEASAQLRRAREVEARAIRLGEITTHDMPARPFDPALHCELGVLLIRMDQKEVGLSWLWSALRLDQGYRPAHAALADYYQSQGDADRAAEHRRQAQQESHAP